MPGHRHKARPSEVGLPGGRALVVTGIREIVRRWPLLARFLTIFRPDPYQNLTFVVYNTHEGLSVTVVPGPYMTSPVKYYYCQVVMEQVTQKVPFVMP